MKRAPAAGGPARSRRAAGTGAAPAWRVNLHLWLETPDGRALLGPGRLQMLRAVETHGSLAEAARTLGMSYRALWAKIHAAEARFGFALVTTHAGRGPSSGTRLTPAARTLLARFERLQAETTAAAQAAHRRIFGATRAR